QLALRLDPILFKLKGAHAFDALQSPIIPDEATGQKFDDRTFAAVINASAVEHAPRTARRNIRLLFNDQASELAAINAVLGAGPVTFTLDDLDAGQREFARPGIERPNCLSCALDNVLSAVVELLVERIASPRTEAPQAMSHEQRSARPSASGASYVVKTIFTKVANKAASYLDRSARVKSSWALGIRPCSDTAGLLDGPWPRSATFNIVPDDNLRYYADPFIVTQGGRTQLFVEEVPMATGRGIISVADVDERGRVGAFRPVLEKGFHLSYPSIFTYNGSMWMLPEACESGSVDLYRAVNYPYQWEFDRRLLDGVPGCDATIIPFGGKYFMMLTASRRLGTTWDTQRIYYADTPLGPWTEIDGGLTHIDCSNARPAGDAISIGGRLLRPAQDCSRGYGSGMVVMDVQQLSRSGCREVPVAKIAVAGTNEFFTHTYGKNHSFEVVDLYGNFGAAKQVTLACTPLAS
nr:hypothetical protein [Hyphomicrobium sp.]